MGKNNYENLLLPKKFLQENIKNTKDIYENRSILKQLLLEDFVLNYLLDIIIQALENGERFRKFDCLQVIKLILKNNPFNSKLKNETVSKLFYLFKTFIFHRNEEVRACANLLIRFQCLKNDDVAWMISNWEKSDHLLNRLLRYPENHYLISQWAIEVYKQGKLKNREAELVALLIEDSIPDFIETDDITLIWAIYYSRITDDIKQKLLKDMFSYDCLEALWKVSIKLKYSSVIQFMQKMLQKRN